MNNKFTKPPLSKQDKEKKAEEFLSFSNERESITSQEDKKNISKVVMKEPTKRITIRLPISLANNITDIAALTGISVNSVCIELLRVSAKPKLQELKS